MNPLQAEPAALERAVLQTIRHAILFCSVDGRVARFNHAAERLFGYRADQVVGKLAVTDFFDPAELADRATRLSVALGRDVEPGFEALVAACRFDEDTPSLVGTFTRKDGSCFSGDSQVTAARDDAGLIIGFLVVVDDVSDRRRIERRLVEAGTRDLINEHAACMLELHCREVELVVLNELNDMLRSCAYPGEVYDVIRAMLLKLLPETSGSLAVFDDVRDEPGLHTVSLWGDEVNSTFAASDCWALRRGRLHSVDARLGAAVCLHISRDAGSYLCAPMIGGGETLGVLHVRQHGSTAVTAERQRLVQAVAGEVGLILANLRLQATLRAQSIRDSLTGVFNRGYLEETMTREVKRAQRDHLPLGVLMLDVDHFKRFNDTFGHEAGDVVLREMGGLLLDKVRGDDVPCRFGGEEFVVVFPGMTLEGLVARAEVIREGVRGFRLVHNGKPLGGVTVSIGASVVSGEDLAGSVVLARADAALYQAKREGRDRVNVAPPTLVRGHSSPPLNLEAPAASTASRS